MAKGYWMEGRGSIPGRWQDFSLLNNVLTGFGAPRPPIRWVVELFLRGGVKAAMA
jgi:hypothetical protein